MAHLSRLLTFVRSKLVHEFSPEPSYVIFVRERVTNMPGIEYYCGDGLPLNSPREKGVEDHPRPSHLTINVKEYYRDFKAGVEKYYSDLKSEMKKDPLDRPLFNNFMKATVISSSHQFP